MQVLPAFTIRTMTLDDYDAVIALMRATPGIGVRDADSREGLARYLERNPGLSFVAIDARAPDANAIVGCIMSGHDGRRGYLQHLLVLPAYRGQGIARQLVAQCLQGLSQLGIHKSHVDVFRDNAAGQSFWENQGWHLRNDICRYSFVSNGNANA
ncbi:MAG: GNAT family N-acetyltransferase [Brachymonas sp.]|nr:GNAT family N-acetyltransferase [Brachymonas sp.]